MSAKRLLVVFCLVALTLAQQQEQPQPGQEQQQPQQQQQEQQKAQEGFQCSEIQAQSNASINVEELAGNETAVLFEIGSSNAVKQYLQKGCSCVRNQLMYLRVGSREGLITNSLCKLKEKDAEARVSGLLLPTEEASVEGVKKGVKAGEETQGKFGFVLLDVDDPRLPQQIQDEWKNLRQERLSALFQTFPQKAKEQAQQKATGEQEQQQPQQQQQPSTPVHRLQRRLMQQQQQEQQQQQKQQEGQQEQQEEGPLATFSPVKQEQPEPIQVQILEHNKERNYMVLTGGCKEFVWILSADPKSIDENAFNEIKSSLQNLGVNADELQIERTEVDDQCIQEGQALESPLSPEKAQEGEQEQKQGGEQQQQQQ